MINSAVIPFFRVLWDACFPCPSSLQQTHQGCVCPFRGVVCCCCFLGVFFFCVYRMLNAVGQMGEASAASSWKHAFKVTVDKNNPAATKATLSPEVRRASARQALEEHARTGRSDRTL